MRASVFNHVFVNMSDPEMEYEEESARSRNAGKGRKSEVPLSPEMKREKHLKQLIEPFAEKRTTEKVRKRCAAIEASTATESTTAATKTPEAPTTTTATTTATTAETTTAETTATTVAPAAAMPADKRLASIREQSGKMRVLFVKAGLEGNDLLNALDIAQSMEDI